MPLQVQQNRIIKPTHDQVTKGSNHNDWLYTQGAVAQIDDTVKHREHSHSGTVTVEKQKQKNICYEYPSSPTF